MEWIEIVGTIAGGPIGAVSTLAVEWIEMLLGNIRLQTVLVSTLAVEWIEITIKGISNVWEFRLHPRGGVD